MICPHCGKHIDDNRKQVYQNSNSKEQSKKFVEFNFYIVAETDKAICVAGEEGEDMWIPKSQINDSDDMIFEKDQTVAVEITEWIAKKKGLI